MNYDEVLNTSEAVNPRRGQLPFGTLQRQLVGNKYLYVLTVSPALIGKMGFIEALKSDLKQTSKIKAPQQLHAALNDSDGGLELEFESGNYATLEQLLDANPAVMAKSDFLDNLVEGLLKVLEELHANGICHVCLSPNNVLIRKNDEMPMLLLHGSSFERVPGYQTLYAGQEAFLAPEVLESQSPTASSDFFSLAKLIEWLCSQAALPYEYKKVVAKATQQNPEERYQAAGELRNDLKNHRNQKRSFFSFIAALAIVLACVGLYFELVPEAEDIEFVEAAPQEPEEDFLDDASFDPELIEDSADIDEGEAPSSEDKAMMNAYMKKAEDIFRKQFTREADRILNMVYNDDVMSSNEKAFLAGSNVMREQLAKAQIELATKAGISDERASDIAIEVINRLTEEKQKSLQNLGYQKEATSE